MQAMISTADLDPVSSGAKRAAMPGMIGQDLAKTGDLPEPYQWKEPAVELFSSAGDAGAGKVPQANSISCRVVAFDLALSTTFSGC